MRLHPYVASLFGRRAQADRKDPREPISEPEVSADAAKPATVRCANCSPKRQTHRPSIFSRPGASLVGAGYVCDFVRYVLFEVLTTLIADRLTYTQLTPTRSSLPCVYCNFCPATKDVCGKKYYKLYLKVEIAHTPHTHQGTTRKYLSMRLKLSRSSVSRKLLRAGCELQVEQSSFD